MKTTITEGGLAALSALLAAEGLAAKKARLYSKTLTDVSLASRMQALSDRHSARFERLMAMLTGKEAEDVQTE